MGRSVVKDGQLMYASPSGIERFDVNITGGCPRRWFYRYVCRMPERQTKAQAAGEAFHNQIEHYLKTGEKTWSEVVRKGGHLIYEPGPDLLIEHWISGSELAIADTPIVGKVDLAHDRGYYIDSRGERLKDDADVEVNDWKTSSNVKRYAKTGEQLRLTVQMPLYGIWAATQWESAELFRLSHTYFPTRGSGATKRTTVVDREFLARSELSIAKTIRQMQDVAKLSPDDWKMVDTNLESCDAYSGCSYREHCPRSPDTEWNGGQMIDAVMKRLADRKNEAPAESQAKPAPGIEPPDVPKPATHELAEPLAPEELAALPEDIRKEAESFEPPPKRPEPLEGGAYSLTEWNAYCEAVKRWESKTGERVDMVDPGELVDTSATAQEPPAAKPKKARKPRKPRKSKKAEAAKNKLDEILGEAKPKAVVHNDPPVDVKPTPLPEKTLRVFVDCLPVGRDVKSLDLWAAKIVDSLCEQNSVADLRYVPSDHELAFGRWKGALASVVKQSPPPPGEYYLPINGSDIRTVIAEALCAIASEAVWGRA